MNNRMRAVFNFFRDNAGYCVGHKAEGALALAKAEQEAKERGLRFLWEADNDADMSFVDTWSEKDREAFWKEDHFAEWCRVEDASGEMLATLGGIIDADSNYRRVIEAELALEALGAIQGAAAQERDAEAFERTTFAL